MTQPVNGMGGGLLRPLSRDTLTQQAVDILKRFVLQAGLEAGDRLPGEHELTASLAVSRHIVREALQVLVTEGIVEKCAGKGTFVRSFDRGRIAASLQRAASYGVPLRDLLEFRIALEIGALELIVARITQDELDALAEIAAGIETERNARNGQSRITNKDDIEFHTRLLKATHNPLFVGMVPLVIEFFRRQVAEHPESLQYRSPDSTPAQHRAIISALQDRDLARAQAAMRAHLG